MISRVSVGMVSIMGGALLTACTTTIAPHWGQGTEAGKPAPVAAQAAVLQSAFSSNASGLQDRSPTYCIRSEDGAGRTDLTKAIVATLRKNPKVKPASSCEIAEGGRGVIDRQTRQRAPIFTVASENCPSDTECLIRSGYYEGNLSAQTNLYRARLVDGRWTVSLEEMGPVS